MTFTVELLAIEPHATYRETVYDQLVEVEFVDGTSLWLFDPDVTVSEDAIGEEAVIEIRTLFDESDVTGADDRSHGIDPETDERTKGHEYYGHITERVDDDGTERFVLDVGVGELSIPTTGEVGETFDVGDDVRLSAIRSDLYDVVA